MNKEKATRMSFPQHANYVIIGAGIHGLSSAWRLAERLRYAGEHAEGKDRGPGLNRDCCRCQRDCLRCRAQQLLPAGDAQPDGTFCRRLGKRS